jgi:hypothetical protein
MGVPHVRKLKIILLSMCPTYAMQMEQMKKKSWTFTTTLQTKPKQKFVSIVFSM